MKQPVAGFHQDEHGDWVADLGCGHGYHMRHDPPWLVRNWVLTSEGRARFIGHLLDCPKCDQEERDSEAELRDGDLQLKLVEFAPNPVHKAPTYHFQMVHARTGKKLGDIRLRVSSTPHIERYAGHIGYSVHPAHRGHRYASRSVRLLMPLARRVGLDPLWITCDPDNIASRRTLELAGAQFVEIVDVPEDCVVYQSGHPRKCRYRLDIGPAEPSCEPSC